MGIPSSPAIEPSGSRRYGRGPITRLDRVNELVVLVDRYIVKVHDADIRLGTFRDLDRVSDAIDDLCRCLVLNIVVGYATGIKIGCNIESTAIDEQRSWLDRAGLALHRAPIARPTYEGPGLREARGRRPHNGE